MRSEWYNLFNVPFFVELYRCFPVATPSEEEFYNVRLPCLKHLLSNVLMHASCRRLLHRILSAKLTPSEHKGQVHKRCGISWP